MTTNKPEVVAWLHRVRQESDVITDKVRHVWGTPVGSMAEYTEPLIRLSDYEALQADYEKLRVECGKLAESLELFVSNPTPTGEDFDKARAALATYRNQGESQ